VVAAFSVDGRAAALAVGKKIVSVLSVPNADQVGGLLHHDSDVIAMAFAPDGNADGNAVATATDDGVISIWDMRSTKPDVRNRPSRRWAIADGGHGRTPADTKIALLLFHPAGGVLLSSTREGIQLWRVDANTAIAGRWLRTAPAVVAAFRESPGELLIGTDRGAFEIWNTATELRLDLGANGPFRERYLTNAFAISPNGAHVITTGLDGVIRRWSPEPARRVELAEGTASIEWEKQFEEWQDRLALVVGINNGQPVPKYPLDEPPIADVTAPEPSDATTSPHLVQGGREGLAPRVR
jgi:WD40 repeat protein